MTFGRRSFLKGATIGAATLAASSGLSVDLADWATIADPDLGPAAPDITLKAFMREAWHVVEPATPFTDGWHIDAIAEHLEAVTRGEIRNLLINMPPRHMKSLCVSVFWPVWSWLQAPHTRWLFSAYAASLSVRDSLKSRRLIESPWFDKRYGHLFRLTSDQNAKTRYDNNRTGYRIATSVGGSATGEGGDVVVVDDPHKASEASSDKKRTAVLEWWDETMSSRLNDQKTGRKVIVMQRVHENDLSGHVMERGGYVHLMLPAEYDARRHTVTSIGWQDPRTQDGELLWPDRVGPDEIAALKTALGSYGFAGQYQQTPMPRGGGMFKREWWQTYTQLPPLKAFVLVEDTAHKEGVHNDYSVIAAWGAGIDGNYYLVDLWRDRAEFGKLLRANHEMYYRHIVAAPPGAGFTLTIEDKGSGTSLLQTLSKPYSLADDEPDEEGRTPIHPALIVGPFPRASSADERDLAALSKIARAEAVVAIAESRRVFVPLGAPWVEAWIAEHEAFPNGQHDDQVDTTAIGLIRLAIAPRKPKQRAATSGSSRSYA